MSSQEILNALQFAVTPICVRLKHVCLRDIGTFLLSMMFMFPIFAVCGLYWLTVVLLFLGELVMA